MSCNTAPYNATLSNSSEGSLTYVNSLYTKSIGTNALTHKSFDFSNINVTSSPYKQYHQTRIYVKEYSGMTTRGKNLGNNTYIISSNLPDNFSYAIGSEWTTPLGNIFTKVGNLMLQMASAALGSTNDSFANKVSNNIKSGINRAANFLIWNGSKPLKLQLNIPVIDDNSYNGTETKVRTNLKEALEFLGCLALPRLEGQLGFYTPAPSPLQIDILYGGNKKLSFSPNKVRIMVQIGGMLFIDNCIIENVSVSYPNTKSLMLRDDGTLSPILANVTIDITTIEALTSTTYTKMLWLNAQNDLNEGGRGTVDLNKIGEAWRTGKDKFIEGFEKGVSNYLSDDSTKASVEQIQPAGTQKIPEPSANTGLAQFIQK